MTIGTSTANTIDRIDTRSDVDLIEPGIHVNTNTEPKSRLSWGRVSLSHLEASEPVEEVEPESQPEPVVVVDDSDFFAQLQAEKEAKAISTRRLTEAEAKWYLNEIRTKCSAVQFAIDKLAESISKARDGEAWIVLGYDSWSDFLKDALPVADGLKLDRDTRREVVEVLSGEGLSNREIAKVTGADEGTVRNDKRAIDKGAENSAPRTSSKPVQSPYVLALKDLNKVAKRLDEADPVAAEILSEIRTLEARLATLADASNTLIETEEVAA